MDAEIFASAFKTLIDVKLNLDHKGHIHIKITLVYILLETFYCLLLGLLSELKALVILLCPFDSFSYPLMVTLEPFD